MAATNTTKKASTSVTKRRKAAVKKEVARLRQLFPNMDEHKQSLVQTLIDDVAFMAVTMAELRERIAENGTISEYQNGENQWGTKQSPDVQTYIALSQKHTAAMKILLDCQPKEDTKPKAQDDGFDDFVTGREDV